MYMYIVQFVDRNIKCRSVVSSLIGVQNRPIKELEPYDIRHFKKMSFQSLIIFCFLIFSRYCFF